MKSPVFTGTCTALITPFRPSGAIDYDAFARQIDRQIEAGVDAVCVCGTTGESAALTVQEHIHLVDACVSCVAGRCKVIAGRRSLPLPARPGFRRGCPVIGDALLQQNHPKWPDPPL